MQVVKRLIKENGDLYIIYVEKMYIQAMIDCVTLLKELKILQKIRNVTQKQPYHLSDKARIFKPDIYQSMTDCSVFNSII